MATILTKTPVITAGAYTAADSIGGVMTVTLQPSMIGQQAMHGFISNVVITDAANVKAAMRLWLYSGTITGVADNDPISSISDADNAKCIGFIDIAASDYATNGSGNATADKEIRKVIDTETGILSVIAVLSGGQTYSSTSDLIFKLSYWPE